MDNEIAAAVQRLQRVDDLEHGNGCRLLTGTAALREVYGEAPEAFRVDGMDLDWLENQLWQDRKALADAYLARESDDAKPVDREWLVSVLGREPDGTDGINEEWHSDTGGGTFTWESGNELWWYGDLGEFHCEDKGDALSAMRLARWPIHETNGGE